MTTAEQRQKPWVEALHEELGDAVSSEPQDLQAHGNDKATGTRTARRSAWPTHATRRT